MSVHDWNRHIPYYSAAKRTKIHFNSPFTGTIKEEYVVKACKDNISPSKAVHSPL